MTTLNELVSDPLFQLNTLLWLTQPLPRVANIRPVLWERGFVVHAIAPQLTLPPDVRLVLKDSGFPHQDSFRPDVVVRRERDLRYGMVECKGKSFGTQSSTAEQARTLVIAAGPRLAEILGLQPSDAQRSAAVYLVPVSAAPQMRQTLGLLEEELHSLNMRSGQTCILGLEPASDALFLNSDTPASDFFDLPEPRVAFLTLEDTNDPRQLYFIPYDPDCCQSPEEGEYCKRGLFERIQATILGAAGRAVPPIDVVFAAEPLLNSAMLGMYGVWENLESAKHMRRLVKQLLGKLAEVVCGEIRDAFAYVRDKGWVLRIDDESARERICSALAKFSCETMDLRRDPEPGLFDDLVDGQAQ